MNEQTPPPQSVSPLRRVCCPICKSYQVKIGSIVKLVPTPGDPTQMWTINLMQNNVVVVDEKLEQCKDFVGHRMAVGFCCGAGHHWSVILIEHHDALVTMDPLQHDGPGVINPGLL